MNGLVAEAATCFYEIAFYLKERLEEKHWLFRLGYMVVMLSKINLLLQGK